MTQHIFATIYVSIARRKKYIGEHISTKLQFMFWSITLQNAPLQIGIWLYWKICRGPIERMSSLTEL